MFRKIGKRIRFKDYEWLSVTASVYMVHYSIYRLYTYYIMKISISGPNI